MQCRCIYSGARVIAGVDPDVYSNTVKEVALFYVRVVCGLDAITAERDSNNEAVWKSQVKEVELK